MGKILLCALLLVAFAALGQPQDRVNLQVNKRGADVVLTWTMDGLNPAHGVFRVYRGEFVAPFNKWTLVGKTNKREWVDKGAARRRNCTYKVQLWGQP